MTDDPIRSAAEVVSAMTGLGTLAFMIFTWIMLGKAAVKVDEIHGLTADLVVHTNSLTDKLMEKTDIAARAQGVKEGVAQQIAHATTATAKDTAEAAALILRVAAENAAMVLAASKKG